LRKKMIMGVGKIGFALTVDKPKIGV